MILQLLWSLGSGLLAPLLGKYSQAAFGALLAGVVALGLYLLLDSYVEKGKAIARAETAASTARANDALAALETEARNEAANSDLVDSFERGVFFSAPPITGALEVQTAGADQPRRPAPDRAPAPRPAPNRDAAPAAGGRPDPGAQELRDRQAVSPGLTGSDLWQWAALALLAIGMALLVYKRK